MGNPEGLPAPAYRSRKHMPDNVYEVQCGGCNAQAHPQRTMFPGVEHAGTVETDARGAERLGAGRGDVARGAVGAWGVRGDAPRARAEGHPGEAGDAPRVARAVLEASVQLSADDDLCADDDVLAWLGLYSYVGGFCTWLLTTDTDVCTCDEVW